MIMLRIFLFLLELVLMNPPFGRRRTLKRFLLLCRFLQCSFVEYRNYKVVYRRYASLFFIVGTDNTGEEVCEILA